MNKKNGIPEVMNNSPEFVKVIFDEKGRPIDILPLKDAPSSLEDNGKNIENTMQKPAMPNPIGQEVIVGWVSNLGQHVKALREDVRLMAIFNQKKFNEMQSFILNLTENTASVKSPEIIERLNSLDSEVSDLRNQYDLVLESLQSVSEEIGGLAERMETMKFPDKEVFGQLNSLNSLNMSLTDQISGLARKLEGMKVPEGAVLDQLNSLDLRVSTIAKEIAETKLHELETSAKLKSLLEDTGSCKTSDIGIAQRLSIMEDEIKKLESEIISSRNCTEDVALNVSQKLNDFSQTSSETNEKLELLKAYTTNAVGELSENQTQIRDLLFNQEQVTRGVAADAVLKIQKMLRKPKRRITKPQRAKVIRFLKKNFKIKPFSKVLVVTDRKNSGFGKTLHEATRAVSKKSVFVIMENRPNKAAIDVPVVEAIKKSSYVFIVGKYSLQKIKKIAKNLRKVKILAIRRTLNYSAL